MGIDSVFQLPSIQGLPESGFVAYGTVDYGIADFDDFKLESSGAYMPIGHEPNVQPLSKHNILWTLCNWSSYLSFSLNILWNQGDQTFHLKEVPSIGTFSKNAINF